MNLKRIILFFAAGLVSFAASFGFVLLTAEAPREADAARVAAPENAPTGGERSAASAETSEARVAPAEKQLNDLVYDLQEKTKLYQTKVLDQKAREQRLQMTAEMMSKDIKRLNELRTQLATVVSELKNQQAELQQSRVQIKGDEQGNLRTIAGTFDRMDATSAAEIVINMCKTNQLEDAVKIIYFMSERTAAKLLAGVSSTEPELAPVLCDRLKRITQTQ